MFNLSKLLSNKEFILGAVIVIIAIVLFSYDGSKRSYMDGLTDGGIAPYVPESNNNHVSHAQEVSEGSSMNLLASDKQHKGGNNNQSLLPKDSNDAFSVLNPSTNLGAMPDLLQAGQHIGMSSTILRNANLQLRCDPPITQQDVGPWMQTTIESDPGRVPLDLGNSCNW